MVATFCAHHNISHLKRGVGTSSNASRDYEIGVIAINHFHGAYGRVHLANTALLHHNLIVRDMSYKESASIVVFFLQVCGESLQLCELLVHCHDNTYFHYVLYCYVLRSNGLQNYTKKTGLRRSPVVIICFLTKTIINQQQNSFIYDFLHLRG